MALSPRRAWLAVQAHKTRPAAAKALGVSLRTLHRVLARDPTPVALREEINRVKAHAMRRLSAPYPPTTLASLRWALRRHWSDPAIATAIKELADAGYVVLGTGRDVAITAVTPTR